MILDLESVDESQGAPIEAGDVHRAVLDDGVHVGVECT